MSKYSFFEELYEYRISVIMTLSGIVGFLAGIVVGLNSLK